ncbi:hypothetical protein EVA_07599 [gut metagenome]|uniref:Uncharacterized protein n=1 Tax=gut metagenome TaxID=749906 RepID=J9GAH1_9ZZZZ
MNSTLLHCQFEFRLVYFSLSNCSCNPFSFIEEMRTTKYGLLIILRYPLLV